MTNRPTVYIFWTRVAIVSSFYFINTPWGPTFLIPILPLRWSKSKVNMMFQYLLTFLENVCPLSIASMTSLSCWFIHMPCLKAIGCLLVLVQFYIIIVTRWLLLCYYCGWLQVLIHMCCWGGRLGMLVLLFFTIGTWNPIPPFFWHIEMYWRAIHFNPIIFGPNVQAFRGVYSSPIRGMNWTMFLVWSQDIKKYVRSK